MTLSWSRVRITWRHAVRTVDGWWRRALWRLLLARSSPTRSVTGVITCTASAAGRYTRRRRCLVVCPSTLVRDVEWWCSDAASRWWQFVVVQPRRVPSVQSRACRRRHTAAPSHQTSTSRLQADSQHLHWPAAACCSCRLRILSQVPYTPCPEKSLFSFVFGFDLSLR